MFGCMERVAEDGFEQLMGHGYGKPAELSPDVLGGDLYVPGIGDCGIDQQLLLYRSAEQLFPHVLKASST